MEKILKYIVPSEDKIVKYGQMNEKLLLELKMTTSLYSDMQVVTNYYDNEDDPYFNNWTDIEGMGYGWVWMRYEEKDWHKMMSQMIGEEVKYLLENEDYTLYFVYENEKIKTYHFVELGLYRKDVIISFSNEELWY
ncbi:hypothetical protein [Priestia flexa]|uniref:hypothetical protein n=1 Tax=Priestia flexa TaxID=86664 RepID=UPI0004743FB2|nr:hypothetical protein [Priestia flexa]